MKKISLLLALAGISLVSSSAFAQEDPWLVRFRVVGIDVANKSDPIGGVGPSDRITESNKVIPEVDFSYYFTPNWATELILTYPQKHDVYLDGNQVGTIKELPPTLTLQYHFAPNAQWNPYLGAGINYTIFSDVSLANGAVTLDSSSVGYALQGGIDYKIDKKWSLNFDIKYVEMRSNVYEGGATVSNIQINPWLFGVGLGYRF